MGSHSKQGWFLFLFLIGFAFLVAGIVYIGIVFTLAGLICLIASLIGFYQIKSLEDDSPIQAANNRAPSEVKARAS